MAFGVAATLRRKGLVAAVPSNSLSTCNTQTGTVDVGTGVASASASGGCSASGGSVINGSVSVAPTRALGGKEVATVQRVDTTGMSRRYAGDAFVQENPVLHALALSSLRMIASSSSSSSSKSSMSSSVQVTPTGNATATGSDGFDSVVGDP